MSEKMNKEIVHITMKTIAQQLGITDFPFYIKDKDGNEIYFEDSRNHWSRRELDSDGNEIYFEYSDNFRGRYEYDSDGNEILRNFRRCNNR